MRAFLLCLLLFPAMVVGQVTWTPDTPPSHAPIPKPKNLTWDLDGTHVVEFTWEFGPETGVEGFWPESCSNNCRGKVHLLHQQCDTSCDVTCRDIHRTELTPYLSLAHSEFLANPERFDHVFEREAGKVGVGPKYPWDQVAWGMIEQIRKPIEEKNDLKVVVRWDHFAKGSCQHALRCHVGYSSTVTLVWEIFRYDVAPDGRQIKVSGGKKRTQVGQLFIPQDGVAEETHSEYCHCSIVREKLDDDPPVRTDPPLPPVEEKRTGAVIRESTSGTQVCDAQTLEKFKFNVVCENMNECTVSCTNTTAEAQKFTLCPGLVFVPLVPGYQDMLLTTPIVINVPPMSTVSKRLLLASTGMAIPEIDPQASGKGRLLCMNMELKEPSAGVGYRIGGSAGPNLSRLAQLTYGSSIRGTHDQVRLWIATDGASLEQMGKILFPKPREGMYADSLFEAFTYARLSNVDPKFERCFEPSLLVGAARARTTPWLVKELTRRDPKKLAAWVGGNSAAFAPLFTETGARLGVPHAANLAASLCQSVDLPVRMAGLKFLKDTIPEIHRAEVAKAGGLAGVAWCVINGSEEEVKAGVDVLELYRSPTGIWALRNISSTAGPALKARALELAKSLAALK